MELTKDMEVILAFVNEFKRISFSEIEFCTGMTFLEAARNVQDMADEGLIELSVNDNGETIAIAKPSLV